MIDTKVARASESRLPELDSLRGMAASAVVIEHLLIVARDLGQQPAWGTLLGWTPLALFSAAHQAVLLFYFLSGFVLAVPFYRPKTLPYPAFLVKRVLRIYPAVWAVLAIDLVLESLIRPRTTTLGTWWWHAPITFHEVLQHVILIGMPTNAAYVPVVWSLTHEIRLSILLPFIAWGISRGYGKKILIYGVPFAAIGFFLGRDSAEPVGTLYYGYVFTWGAYLAYRRQSVTAWMGQQPSARVAAIVTVGAFCYLAYSPLAESLLPGVVFKNIGPWLGNLGAAIFLCVALGAPAAHRVLRLRPVVFLGRISYSFYLVHVVVLYALMYGWHPGGVPAWIPMFVVTPVLSVVSAWLLFVLVERPTIRLGAYLAKRMATGQTPRERPAVSRAA